MYRMGEGSYEKEWNGRKRRFFDRSIEGTGSNFVVKEGDIQGEGSFLSLT